MAHHKLRSGASPSPRRAADQKSLNGDTPHQNSNQDTENYQPASVESLARRCAACFDEKGDCKDEEFPRLLFLTHPWFMTSEQLVALFTQMFEDEETTVSVKTQVLQAIRYWMKEIPQVFDLNLALVEAVKNLQTLAARDANLDASLIDLSNRGNYRWMRTDRLSLRPATGAGRKSRKVSLVFHHLEPAELAIHISYLEFKCFRRLTFEDFHNYAVRATIKSIARLERCVFLFNNITLWVQCMVLGQHTPQERAGVITKYIKIAQKLHEMRSYNALMAVVGGLTHTAIARLKKTMSALSRDSIKALDELVDLLDSRFNYIAYRRDYANAEGVFKIPIIGVHLKDIISLHTALLDRDGNGLINVKKMVTIGSIFQEFLNLQRLTYPHDVNKDLLNTLRVSLYLYYTEEEIYALSLQREPRDTKNSVSGTNSPSKASSMVFSEFTKFTCQLDNKTVKQHVKAMVESVFKAYDHDSDGFISEEEFVSFKDNFPMMESFSAMDVDRDGKISRDEMCEYFMKASAGKRNDFCQNFTHEFTETTYFHPTFCEECQKLLWGLVKQGWKCKGCGINCHKHCKDRIVQECRPKQPNNQVNSLKANGSRQQKSSVSSESDLSANGDAVPVIGNSSANAQHLDDETFDSTPGELTHFKTSPLVMRRTASLASSDGMPRSKTNRNSSSKTPPLPRKYQESGKKSFQDKMLRIIPRRSNSNKIRITAEVSTQTHQDVAPPLTPIYPVKKSFLYPKAPSSPKLLPVNGNPVKQRLGSCGEELDESNGQANNNNTEPTDNDTKLHARRNRHETLSNTFSNNSVRYPAIRRDSGLSGCFIPASCENSLPVTPDFHTRMGNQLSSTFKFPTNFVYEDLNGSNSTSEAMNNLTLENSNLTEENNQLQKANETLTKELTSLKEYVGKLQTYLKDSGLEFPKIES